MRSPVSHEESSDARKTATRAMSSGWPKRPSGVMPIICFSKSLPRMGAQDLRRFAIEHLLECAQASRQRHARGNHLGDIPIIFGFGAIECRLQLGRHQIVERCDKQCAVAGLKWIIDAAKADATEKRNLHQAGWHFGQHHQRVRRVLQDCCPANKSERVAYLILVERFISEKVEIERFSMSEMERDGCPPVEDKTQLKGGC